MKNKQCYKQVQGKEDVYSVVVQIAITDVAIEGSFVDYYSGNEIEYLPWAQDRPQKNAVNYNCVRITVEVKDINAKYGEMSKAEIWDGRGGEEECALCDIPAPTAKMRVRGLCKVGSLYDKEYNYMILENGIQAYLGIHTSVIAYDAEEKHWSWTDSKDEGSKGTIN